MLTGRARRAARRLGRGGRHADLRSLPRLFRRPRAGRHRAAEQRARRGLRRARGRGRVHARHRRPHPLRLRRPSRSPAAVSCSPTRLRPARRAATSPTAASPSSRTPIGKGRTLLVGTHPSVGYYRESPSRTAATSPTSSPGPARRSTCGCRIWCSSRRGSTRARMNSIPVDHQSDAALRRSDGACRPARRAPRNGRRAVGRPEGNRKRAGFGARPGRTRRSPAATNGIGKFISRRSRRRRSKLALVQARCRHWIWQDGMLPHRQIENRPAPMAKGCGPAIVPPP